MKYKISEEFTKTPGGRYRSDGKFSGQEFKEDVLENLLKIALVSKEKIVIDLDDTYGYPSSFLEEAFGGLARDKGINIVKKTFEFKSDDEPLQIERILGYIDNATKQN